MLPGQAEEEPRREEEVAFVQVGRNDGGCDGHHNNGDIDDNHSPHYNHNSDLTDHHDIRSI